MNIIYYLYEYYILFRIFIYDNPIFIVILDITYLITSTIFSAIINKFLQKVLFGIKYALNTIQKCN